MNFGFSEAEIFIGKDSVLKLTPQAKEQAATMLALGPQVCPRVLSTHNDYYIMEKLKQPNPPELFTVAVVKEIHRLLKERVHCKPYLASKASWRQSLWEFLQQQEQTIGMQMLERLYPDNQPDDLCLIHGDPTLANVMLRGEQILLIDPVKPRGKVPSLREVDYGKMLQSAIDWEAAQQKLPYKSEHLIKPVLDQVDNPRLAWFWCAVHLIRLFPRAQKRPDIVDWANEQIGLCWSQIL